MTALFLYTSSSICYWSLSEHDKLNAHLAQFQYSPSSVVKYLISRDKIPHQHLKKMLHPQKQNTGKMLEDTLLLSHFVDMIHQEAK